MFSHLCSLFIFLGQYLRKTGFCQMTGFH